MINKLLSPDIFKSKLKDNMSIMFGGFMGVGTPDRLVDLIIESKVKGLTLIGNDTAFENVGIGKLIATEQVSQVIVSHIGTNALTGKKMIDGTLVVNLVPQGTLIEQIRAGGSGIGGFLTKTGIGTVVQEGKDLIVLDGVDYILEKPIRADLSILLATKSDIFGNLFYEKASKNFNPIIAMASDYVVAYSESHQNEPLDPEGISTPGVFVDAILFEDIKDGY